MIRWENRIKVKKAGLIVLTCGMLFLTACGGKRDSGSHDVISQKKVEEGRTAVTILVKYAFSINSFEKAVEEKFPDIDIIQIGNYTPDMGIEEYSRRLEHDDLTDIVMTWPLDVGEEYWSDRLLDLSGEDFTRYSTVFKVPLGFVYLGFFVFQIITIVRYCGDLAGCFKEFRKGGKAV